MFTSRGGMLIIRDLDQVVVGVADIDGLDRADSAGARAGPGDDRNAEAPEMDDDFSERGLADKAQIARAGGRLVGDKTGDVVGRVQVDLLLAKAERGAPLAKRDDLHAEDACVEIA